MDKLTRKEFLQKAAVAGLAGTALGRLGLGRAAAAAAPLSTVALVSSERAIQDGKPVAEVVAAMVNKAVSTLTGKPVLAAWKSLFKPTDVVGIKVNCSSGPRASSRPEVVLAVAQGAISAGVQPENIIIYERTMGELRNAGFKPNKDGPGVRGIGIVPDDGWEAEPTSQGRFRGPLARLLSQRITALVNVPVLKDHDVGVTFAMKNHFGSIGNPSELHRDIHNLIPELNLVPAIRGKTRLILGDCLLALADGGPVARRPDLMWECKTVLAAFDPVAADYTAWQMLEEGRKLKGFKPLAEVGREPKYIAAAAAAGLGTNDPARIKVVKLTV